MKNSVERTYRTMIALCVIVCVSVIVHFILFIALRQDEVLMERGSEVMWVYWSRLLTRLESAVMFVLVSIGDIVRAKSVMKEFLEDVDKDPELADTFYWLIIIVGVLDVGSAIRLLTKFNGVFSLLFKVGYIGAAIGMLVTIVVPMVLVAWWTIQVVMVLRKRTKTTGKFS